jgi:hypothetical protein
MEFTPENPPAFPAELEGESNSILKMPGMSLRDYFAAHAPQLPEAWFDKNQPANTRIINYAEASAGWRYFYADAMLRERMRK